MESGTIVELIKDMTFYKKGRLGTFVRYEEGNNKNAEIIWLGEENIYGDVEVVPVSIIREYEEDK